MKFKPVRPEDTVPDNSDYVQFSGRQVRKGTFAAIILNIAIAEDLTASSEEKTAALGMIKELMPNIVLFGAGKHLTWKNPQVQQIMTDISKAL